MGADMAQNTDIDLPIGAWTLLSNADITAITFQNKSGNYILVKGTAGAVTPTDDGGSIRYNAGQGERKVLLADVFLGIAATRVYAYAPTGGIVMVSHT